MDEENRAIFAGECKWRNAKADVDVLKGLQEKVSRISDIPKGYEVIYGVFSGSGCTDELEEYAAENGKCYLIVL